MTNKCFPQQIVCSNGLYLRDVFPVCRVYDIFVPHESVALRSGSLVLGVAVSSAVCLISGGHTCAPSLITLCHATHCELESETRHIPPPASPPLCQLSALRSPPSLPEPSQPALTDHSDSHGCGSESGSERLCPNLLLRPRPCPPLTLVST